MKKLTVLIGLSILITSCIHYKYGSSIKLEGKKQVMAGIYYKSFEYLTSEKKHPFKESLIPKGGRIFVKIASYSITGGNTENWSYIISDKNNKEIEKGTGIWSLPSTPKANSNLWTNMLVMSLDTNINDLIKVKIINDLTNNENNFNIYPNQDIRKN